MTAKRYGNEIVSEDPEYDHISHCIVIDVLNGQTFEAVGKKYGMKRQSAWQRFWMTVVRRPFVTILPGTTRNINDLRKYWNDFHELKNGENE